MLLQGTKGKKKSQVLRKNFSVHSCASPSIFPPASNSLDLKLAQSGERARDRELISPSAMLPTLRMLGGGSWCGVRALHLGALDHVCVCVSDVDRSIAWYEGVLGLSLRHADHPAFGKDPAFLANSAGACVALLPLAHPMRPIADHGGAHFALRVPDTAAFKAAAAALPAALTEHRVSAEQSVEVDEQDYGLQRSLFFADPDNNIVEITCWMLGNGK